MILNKKGFTLIEIIIVLFLLSVIFLFAVPSFNNSTRRLKDENRNLIETNIKSAAKNYLELNISTLDKDYFACGNYYLSIQQLISAGFLSKPLVDPITKEEIDYDKQVEISYDSSTNTYNFSYPAVGSNITKNNITSLVSGNNHTLLINNNKLYGVGNNNSNQLSLSDSSYSIFTEIHDNVSFTTTKGDSSYYINNNSELYGFGSNNYGQLGLGDITNTSNIEEIVVDSAKSVITSGETTFIISNDNRVYVTGKNINGQLGIGNNDNILYPTVNKAMHNPKSIIPTNLETYFTTIDNSYVAGNNVINEYNIIDISLNIEKIIASNDNTFLILENGDVYAKGKNLYGTLGLGNTSEVSNYTKINSLSNIKDIKLTELTTFFITNTNEIYAVGENSYGQLGLGNYTSIQTPTKINEKNIIDVYPHKNFTFFVKNNKELYATGYNQNGELGLDTIAKTNKVTHIPNVSNVKYVSISSNGSVYVVNENNHLYVTGYNQNGELGLGNSNSIKTFKSICLN